MQLAIVMCTGPGADTELCPTVCRGDRVQGHHGGWNLPSLWKPVDGAKAAIRNQPGQLPGHSEGGRRARSDRTAEDVLPRNEGTTVPLRPIRKPYDVSQ